MLKNKLNWAVNSCLKLQILRNILLDKKIRSCKKLSIFPMSFTLFKCYTDNYQNYN